MLLMLSFWAALASAADASPVGEEVKCPVGRAVRYYPEQARQRRIEGSAVVSCAVAEGGRLRECRVVSEEPAGAGFGQTALVMAQCLMRAKEGSVGSVEFPIRFKLPR